MRITAGVVVLSAGLVAGCALPEQLRTDPRRPLAEEPLVRGARDVSAFLPAPAGTAVVLGAGLIASLARSKQLKKGAASIAAGIEQAKRENAEFARVFAEVKDHVRAPQTRSAEAIVRAVKRSGDPAAAARGL